MKYNGAGLQSDKPIININNANLIFSKNHYFINKWVPSLKYPDFLILCIFFHLREFLRQKLSLMVIVFMNFLPKIIVQYSIRNMLLIYHKKEEISNK